MPITFRSLRANHIRTGNSLEMIRAHGSDWSHLRGYATTDDARDIVWGKSTDSTHTYVKERQDTGGFHITLAWLSALGDDFSSPVFPVSRSEFREKGSEIIKYNSHIGGHDFDMYENLGKIVQRKPKNHLVLVFSSTLDTADISQLGVIAPHNDLIFFHVFHPYEIRPGENLLFLGKELDMRKYKTAFEKNRKDIEKYIDRIGGSYTQLSTTEDIEKRLNYFFKNRFRHG